MAYHQLELSPDSRDVTAFITHDGLDRYRRVCFGIASAPSAFQKTMCLILSGLPGVQCYIDDIVVSGKDQESHDENLRRVLQRLQDKGVVLNEGKCEFHLTSLPFLGHVVSATGLQPDPSRVRTIVDAPTPTDSTTLRSFLGLVGFYQRFLPTYSTIVEPMRALLRDNCVFKWSSEAQESFDSVKALISEGAVLQLFDPDLDVIVTTDASGYGIGAVMSQMRDGLERPIAFASRKLTAREKTYSVGEREALACIWSCEKWHSYLWRKEFTLRTDHKSLTTLLSTKGTGRKPMRIARWSAWLMNYNFRVEYKVGSENCVADAMSRLPLPDTSGEDVEDELVCNVFMDNTSITKTELQMETTADSHLSRAKNYIQNGWPEKKYVPNDLLPLFRIRDELTLIDDIVFRGERVVVPMSLQTRLISIAHKSHQGVVRTKQRLREIYWWSGLDGQVENLINSCATCQSNDKTAKTSFSPLQPVPLPEAACEKVALDIVGPIENAPGNCRFAITLVDYYSKWPEVAFTSSVTSSSVITMLKSIFSREGYPREIVTDNGPQLTSQEFEDFLFKRNITHRYSAIYHPQANGAIERFNGSLGTTIQTAMLEGKPLKVAVLEFLCVYRATPRASTGCSPSELLHGRRIRTGLDITGATKSKSITLQRRSAVRTRVEQKQKDAKGYFDKRHAVKSPKLHIGDKVRVRKPGHVPKGQPKFSGPMEIIAQKGQFTFVTSDGKAWNCSRLSKCSSLAPSVCSPFETR